MKIDPEKTKAQVDRVKKLKKNRNFQNTKMALNKLEESANSNKNLMPAIIECVESYATLGEISDALRNVFGTYHENGF